MATTAHEVSLGVSVETAAALSSLEALQTKVRDIGATFSGAVSQLNGFLGAFARLGGALNSVSGGAIAGWGNNMAQAGNSAAIAGVGVNAFTTAINTLSRTVANANLAGFSSQITTLQSSAAQMATVATQIAPFSRAIKDLGTGVRSLGKVDITNGLTAQISALQNATPAMTTMSGTLSQFGTSVASIGSSLASISGGSARATQFGAIVNSLIPTLNSLAGATVPPAGVVLGVRYALTTLGSALATLSTSGIRTSAATAFSSAVSALINGLSTLSTAAVPPAGVAARYNAIITQLVAAFNSISASGITAAATSQFGRAIASIVKALSGMGSGPNTAGVAAFSSAIQSLGTSLAAIPASSVATITAIGNALRSMSASAAGLGSLPSTLSRLSGALSRAGDGAAINSTAGAVGALTSRLTSLVGAYFGAQAIRDFSTSVMNTGADFDFAMGTVKAVSRNTADYSTAAFNAMETEALRMGRTTTYSASQAAEALRELTQGGLTTKQATAALSETMKLAETEQMSVADASRIVTSMMAQFQAGAGELSTYVDKLAKTSAVSKTSIDQLKYALAYTGTAARSANQSFDEVVSAVGALSTAGVESSQAGTTMRDMLSDLTDTTSLASRKLRSLGFDINELNPRYNNLSQIITKLRNRGVDAADAMAIFGVRGGLAAGSLITVYKQYMETLDAVKNKSQGAADQMQKDVTENLRGDLKKLSASWENFVVTIFKSGFGEFMRGVVDSARTAVLYAADFVQMFKNASTVGKFQEGLSIATELAFGKGINILIGGVFSAGEALAKAVMVIADPKFWNFLFEIGKTLGLLLESAAFSLTNRLLDGGKSFMVDLITGLLNAADTFIGRMTSGIQKVLNPIEYTKLSSARDKALQTRNTLTTDVQNELKNPNSKYSPDVLGEVVKKAQADLDLAQRAVDAFLGTMPINANANKVNAEAIVTGMGNDVNDVAANFRTAAEQSLNNVTALGKGLFTDSLKSIKEASNNFSPVNVVDTTKVKREWDSFVKEFFPKALQPPPKDNSQVAAKGTSSGVGSIEMTSKKPPLNIVADSLQSIGGGGNVFGWAGALQDPQEKTAENTKRTAENTKITAEGTKQMTEVFKRLIDGGSASATPNIGAGLTSKTPVIAPDVVAAQNRSSDLLTQIKDLLRLISTRNIVVKTSPLTVATV